MDVDWNLELVDELESHWVHQVRPRLTGLTTSNVEVIHHGAEICLFRDLYLRNAA